MENHKDNDSVDPQQCEEHVHQTKNVEGCIDHLLILAQSVEIVAQSEHGVARMDAEQNNDLHNNLVGQTSQGYSTNITSDDQEYSREPLHSSPVDSPLSSQCCEFHNEVRRPCLTQILKQIGCEYLIMDGEKRGDNQCKHLHGKTIRLSQIKHQARCKSKKDLAPQKMITRLRNEQPQGRILRLSQMKHEARFKGNATAKEGYLAQKIVRRIQSRSHQFAAVKWDYENIREHQHTIGLTSINNSLWFSHNATLLKDKNFTACQQELPTGCSEKFRANFGLEKLQGYLGSIESSGVRCNSVTHIPNGFPVQNSGLPYNSFQQYATYLTWMSYMHHVRLRENYRVAAHQHRAVCIQEKMALKDKQQNSKNHVQGKTACTTELYQTQLKRD
ncbi:unnamed protein product [Lupinus luteus]|uniref:Uncharacterized protein n=1 Tax=Lupinus luteus TaxID=3873 RepID=A0AAV1X1D7_LUPLU